MAKSQLNYKRTITDKMQVKGMLSEDATTIKYEDENGVEQYVKITELFKTFSNQFVDISVNLKSEEELDLVSPDTDDDDEDM